MRYNKGAIWYTHAYVFQAAITVQTQDELLDTVLAKLAAYESGGGDAQEGVDEASDVRGVAPITPPRAMVIKGGKGGKGGKVSPANATSLGVGGGGYSGVIKRPKVPKVPIGARPPRTSSGMLARFAWLATLVEAGRFQEALQYVEYVRRRVNQLTTAMNYYTYNGDPDPWP